MKDNYYVNDRTDAFDNKFEQSGSNDRTLCWVVKLLFPHKIVTS